MATAKGAERCLGRRRPPIGSEGKEAGTRNASATSAGPSERSRTDKLATPAPFRLLLRMEPSVSVLAALPPLGPHFLAPGRARAKALTCFQPKGKPRCLHTVF
jgi:hypothetical protein